MFSFFGPTVIQWPWWSRISKPSFSVYHFADFFASDTTRAIVVRRIMGTGLIPADKGHGHRLGETLIVWRLMADGMTRSRLELARTVTAQLRRREGRNLLAVGLYGSVSRGEDRAHSDIDLVLLVRSGKTGLQMLMRNGVLVSLLRLTRGEAADAVRGYS